MVNKGVPKAARASITTGYSGCKFSKVSLSQLHQASFPPNKTARRLQETSADAAAWLALEQQVQRSCAVAAQRAGTLPTDKKVKFVAFGGDGGTYDIGLQSLSGAMERGHDMVYVCYDNGAYMNTGIQRSSATPDEAANHS